MWAIVPLKRLENAKRRLSRTLSPDERTALCKAMLADVLESLAAAAGIDGIVVVSDDPDANSIASSYGCEFLSESELDASGLNGVITATVARLASRGINDVLVVHGDLPVLEPGELATLIRTHRNAGDMSVTIAADSRRSGSNIVAASPAHCLSYQFGEDSLGKHLRAARDAGMKSTVLVLPGASLDIDIPADLQALRGKLARDSLSHTNRCLRGFEPEPTRVNLTNGLPQGPGLPAVLNRSE